MRQWHNNSFEEREKQKSKNYIASICVCGAHGVYLFWLCSFFVCWFRAFPVQRALCIGHINRRPKNILPINADECRVRMTNYRWIPRSNRHHPFHFHAASVVSGSVCKFEPSKHSNGQIEGMNILAAAIARLAI